MPHFDPLEMTRRSTDLLDPLLNAEARVFTRVAQHGNHQAIEQMGTPFDHIQMPKGQGVEAAGVQDFHPSILEREGSLRPAKALLFLEFGL